MNLYSLQLQQKILSINISLATEFRMMEQIHFLAYYHPVYDNTPAKNL